MLWREVCRSITWRCDEDGKRPRPWNRRIGAGPEDIHRFRRCQRRLLSCVRRRRRREVSCVAMALPQSARIARSCVCMPQLRLRELVFPRSVVYGSIFWPRVKLFTTLRQKFNEMCRNGGVRDLERGDEMFAWLSDWFTVFSFVVEVAGYGIKEQLMVILLLRQGEVSGWNTDPSMEIYEIYHVGLTPTFINHVLAVRSFVTCRWCIYP